MEDSLEYIIEQIEHSHIWLFLPANSHNVGGTSFKSKPERERAKIQLFLIQSYFFLFNLPTTQLFHKPANQSNIQPSIQPTSKPTTNRAKDILVWFVNFECLEKKTLDLKKKFTLN